MEQKREVQKREAVACCALCLQEHLAEGCTTYKSVGARIDKAREMKLCLKCLQCNHQTSECQLKTSCRQCKEPHNLAFCSEVPTNEIEKEQEQNAEELQGPKTENVERKRSAQKALGCALCQKTHWTNSCTDYQTVGARIDKAREMKLCFRCLQSSHRTAQCRTTRSCRYCRGPHNSSFCNETPTRVTGKTREERTQKQLHIAAATGHLENGQDFANDQKEKLNATPVPATVSLGRKTEASNSNKTGQSRGAIGPEALSLKAVEDKKANKKLERSPSCAFCRRSHWSDECDVYETGEDREYRVMELGICFKCLRYNHRASECNSKGCCFQCKGRHNTAFCKRILKKKKDSDTRKESDSETAKVSSSVRVKWKHNDTFCCFELPIQRGYAALMEIVKKKVPEFDGELAWKDQEDDMVTLSSDEDLAYAVSVPENQEVLRLFTIEKLKLIVDTTPSNVAIYQALNTRDSSSINQDDITQMKDDGNVALKVLMERIEELEGDLLINADSSKVKDLTDRIEELEIERSAKVHDLKDKIDELESQVLCKICSERRAEIAYQCGHTICLECDNSVRTASNQTYWEPVLCCFCRKEVTSRIRIYN